MLSNRQVYKRRIPKSSEFTDFLSGESSVEVVEEDVGGEDVDVDLYPIFDDDSNGKEKDIDLKLNQDLKNNIESDIAENKDQMAEEEMTTTKDATGTGSSINQATHTHTNLMDVNENIEYTLIDNEKDNFKIKYKSSNYAIRFTLKNSTDQYYMVSIKTIQNENTNLYLFSAP